LAAAPRFSFARKFMKLLLDPLMLHQMLMEYERMGDQLWTNNDDKGFNKADRVEEEMEDTGPVRH